MKKMTILLIICFWAETCFSIAAGTAACNVISLHGRYASLNMGQKR